MEDKCVPEPLREEVDVITEPDQQRKLLYNCNNWELLNLSFETILGIPDQLYKARRHGVSRQFLEKALYPYLAQTITIQEVMKRLANRKQEEHEEALGQPVILAPCTSHYSWHKAAGMSVPSIFCCSTLKMLSYHWYRFRQLNRDRRRF